MQSYTRKTKKLSDLFTFPSSVRTENNTKLNLGDVLKFNNFQLT